MTVLRMWFALIAVFLSKACMAPNPDSYGNIGVLPPIKDIQNDINKAYDSLFVSDLQGQYKFFVCSVCDEYVLHRNDRMWLSFDQLKKKEALLRWDSVFKFKAGERIPELEQQYEFKDVPQDVDATWLKNLALSPRGCCGRKGKRGKQGISCCTRCYGDLTNSKKPKTPLFAIVNNNACGNPPECLTCLNEVELAMITPVQTYGYCFSFVGGAQKNLRGTLTFMKTDVKKITRAMTHLEAMGFNDKVVILLSGKMTAKQREKVKGKVRTNKLIEAVEWLVQNHRDWKNVDINELRTSVQDAVPVIVDKSKEVENEAENVEDRELFSCYFPDGTMTNQKGGFESMEEFKTCVDELEKRSFDMKMKLELEKDYLKGSDGERLIGSSLLQFPYGVGAMDSPRLQADGSWTARNPPHEFLSHLSLLSQNVFQMPMFQLILYSVASKLKIMKMSRLKCKGDYTAKAISEGLTHEDLSKAIDARRKGFRTSGTPTAKEFLYAVDAVSKSLPHTNDAAGTARSTAESMMHHFGTPSIFLTVTFDDENSLLMEVMSGKPDCWATPDLANITEDKLKQESAERHRLRLDFPGLAAMNFEVLLDVLCEEVVGWSRRKNEPTEKPGLFGEVDAMSFAAEEQGRTTLHTHMLLWIKGFAELQRTMFFGSARAKRTASEVLKRYHERVATTSFFEGSNDELLAAFDHKCTGKGQKRPLPSVIDDQALRDLRHKRAYDETNGLFATCRVCGATWTYEKMVNQYLRRVADVKVPSYGHDVTEEDKQELDEAIPKARLQRMVMDFQRNRGATDADIPCSIINGLYQHHNSRHVAGCFHCTKKKKGKSQRAHVCGPKCECRYRLPDRKRKHAQMAEIEREKKWYNWKGDSRDQPLVEFQVKRNTYDLFQNTSCKAISESKFSCNSNVAVVTDGPVSIYTVKYVKKKTQDEDTAKYGEVEQSIKGLNGRVYEDNKKEAIRRVCRASFAHNKSNVIGCAMASFLTRNASRFYFSHTFLYCPLKDLMRIHANEKVSAEVKYTSSGHMYLENVALHYLCRHDDLEDVSFKEFVEGYAVIPMSTQLKKKGKKRAKTEATTWRFKSTTQHFAHPSATKNSDGTYGLCAQGVKERDEPGLIKVPQWQFVDTEKFGFNMLTCLDHQLNAHMDEYAHMILTLMLPHRHDSDLESVTHSDFPHVWKLREVNKADVQLVARNEKAQFFTWQNEKLLQNIQNTAYNSTRYKVGSDDLARNTNPFKPDNECGIFDDSDSDDDSDDDGGCPYDDVLEELNKDLPVNPNDKDSSLLFRELQNFDLSSLRNAGSHQCGINTDLPVPKKSEFAEATGHGDDFVTMEPTFDAEDNQDDLDRTNRQKPALEKIIEVLFERRESRIRKDVFARNPHAMVAEANGSVRSITDWADAANLDQYQKRAFETIVSSFILTFYDDVDSAEALADSSVGTKAKRKFRRMKMNLLRLKGGKESQLVCLLHGPGGSGKSTVINLVTAYAREYCELVGHPFTSRTIITTAMSGVAATLLHGETTHKALGMNCGKKTLHGMVECWQDARLVIIDEISFAAESDFQKIHQNLQILLQDSYKPYGGVNILFAGDYSQLEPPKRDPVYKDGRIVPEFHSTLNSFIELDGSHRFSGDPPWGERLLRFRNGDPTKEDIDFINEHCFVNEDRKPPPGVQIACYENRDRDAMNAAVFEEFCADNQPADGSVFGGAILIFMDNLQMTTSSSSYKPVESNQVKAQFYRNCGENSINKGSSNRKRIDPTLKLYAGCPMMLTDNADVANGQANGSRVTVKRVNLRHGVTPMIISLASGCKVRGYLSTDVQYIEVEHEIADIMPRTFQVKSEEFTFTAHMPIGDEVQKMNMKGEQFSLISNSATTGHKLQGYTATSLLVSSWHYRENWVYVVLSRVKTMNGLYLLERLTKTLSKYAMSKDMKKMLEGFRKRFPMTTFTVDEYNQMYADEDTHD